MDDVVLEHRLTTIEGSVVRTERTMAANHRQNQTALEVIAEEMRRMNGTQREHGMRLTRVELWRAYISGAVAVAVVLLVPVAIETAGKLFLR